MNVVKSGDEREDMSTAFAHATFQELWQPNIIVFTVVVLVLYLGLCHGPLAQRLSGTRHLVTPLQTGLFVMGMILLYFSFAGPLDYLSDNYLYTAHMVQHMVEITIMTPLVMKGLPESVYRFLFTSRRILPVTKAWTHPIVSGAVFNVILTIFHLPYLYNLALESDSFHLFEHSVFFVISFFMWLPIVRGTVSKKQMTPGQKMLYLLYNYNLMMPLVVFQLVANRPWYAHYVDAPRIFPNLSALGDMQLGAITMMVFMAGRYAIVGIQQYMKQDESVWYE